MTSEQPAHGQNDAHALAGAFEMFMQASRALEQQYAELSLRAEALSADLVQANERLTVLLNALPAAVVLIEDERVSHFNLAARALMPELKTGSPWAPPAAWLPGHGPDEYHVQTHGQMKTLQMLRVDRGGLSVVQIQDITANLQTLEEKERMDRLAAMGKMSAGIAHQLRTPLSTALLYASHLCSAGLDAEQRMGFAKKLQQQLIHLEKMASEMLQFIRARPQKTQVVAVDELALEAIGQLDGLRQQKGIHLVQALEADRAMVSVERPSMVSALVAILENALQVCSPEQKVSISTRCDGLRAVITIEDNGPGIAPDMLQCLFEPFATNRVTGTGLGLAIASNTVASHRGEIQAHNKPAGGAQFTVTLPALANL